MPSLQLGIDTTVTGMGIVFLVLIFLSLITWLLSAIVDGGIARREARRNAKAVAEIPATVAAAPVATGLSAKTVAAIMAAVGAASGLPISELRFTAIRRTGGANSAWSASGTTDIIANRQAYL